MAPFGKSFKKPKDNVRSSTRPQKAFHSSRLHEPQSAPLEIQSDLDEGEQNVEVPEQDSGSDDEDFAVNINPYNALLVSLNLQAVLGKPARKKRKVYDEPSRFSLPPPENPISLEIQPTSTFHEGLDQTVEDKEDLKEVASDSDEGSDSDGKYIIDSSYLGLTTGST